MDIEQDETSLNVGINISSGDYSASFHANIEFDPTAIIMNRRDYPQIIILKYAQTCSIGSQDNSLILLTETQNDQINEEACDALIASITQGTQGNYVLSGNYLLNIDFSQYGTNVMRQVYEQLSQHMGEAAECGSNHDEQFQETDQMVTANDIDEDGNLKMKGQFQEQQQKQRQFEEHE